MKRALAIIAVLCLFGTLAFGQTITGRWRLHTYITDLQTPSFTLRTDLLVNYKVGDWTFSGYGLATGSSGFYYAYLSMVGKFGPFDVNTYLNFIDPALAVTTTWYYYTSVGASFDFGGVTLGSNIYHSGAASFGVLAADLGIESLYPTWSFTMGAVGSMLYHTYAKVAPVRFDVFWYDPCTGVQFNQLLARLEKLLVLCCPVDVTFSFKKASGFDYMEFGFSDLSICCGWSFGARITYGLTTKSVTILPKFGPVDSCFKLFGGPKFAGNVFEGWNFHGFACSVKIGDCNEIGFLTAFYPEYFWAGHRGIIRHFPAMASRYVYKYSDTDQPLPGSWTGYPTHRKLFTSHVVQEVTVYLENEVFWYKACGAGCCGGTWTLEVNVFTMFSNPAPGTLFGITRIQALASLPIMTNFTADIYVQIGKYDSVTKTMVLNKIGVFGGGFTFSF